jgi:hypothetical protein
MKKKINKEYFKNIYLPLIFFIFILINPNSSAKNDDFNKIQFGLDALYNFEFEKAEQIFNELIDINPEQPAAFHYKSIPQLWFYLDSKDRDNLERFISLSDSVIKKTEILLNTETDNLYLYYIIGTSYSYRALAYTRSEEYLNALWATKNFYSYLNRAIEMDSSFYDAYLGLGIYNFAVSRTAPAWKWALELTGISGEMDAGFEYLKLASEKGKWSKTEAQFYLSQLLSEFSLDVKTADKYLRNLNNKYPGNLLFKLAIAELYIQKTELRKAEKKLREVINSPDTLFKQIKCISKYSIANLFFIQNQFDSSKYYYSEFLDSVSGDHFKGMAAFRLGLSYLFTDQPELAKNYFDISSEGNMDLDEDRYASIKGTEYYEDLPDSVELSLIYSSNLIRSGKYNKAIELLNTLVTDSSAESNNSIALLYLSDALFLTGSYAESLNFAMAAFRIETSDKWVKAFACYYAARASKEMDKIVDANLFIQYAGKYSDYIYENKLKNLLYALSYSMNK